MKFTVPVTIADKRMATVNAKSKQEAERKVAEGRYVSLGRSLTRGILLVGDAEPKP